jgi:hypothetical protein
MVLATLRGNTTLSVLLVEFEFTPDILHFRLDKIL